MTFHEQLRTPPRREPLR